MHRILCVLVRFMFVLFASTEVGYILALVSNVTSIIERLQRGESKAAEELLPLCAEPRRSCSADLLSDKLTPGKSRPVSILRAGAL